MPRHTHVIFSAAILLALVVSSVLSVGPAYAATFTVNTTADSVDANPGNGVCADSGGACSLRAAIMEANALAGADVITLPVGTYLLTLPGADNTGAGGDLDITESLTITGAGSGSTTIQQTVSGERVIHIVLDVTVSISGVTITGGSGTTGQGGSGIYNNGTLTVNNSVITGNTTTYQGGGIYNNSGTLTITNSTISNNSAARRGGGILTTGSGALTVTNSVIESNTASGTNSFDGGGGIHTTHDITVQGSTFRNNQYNGDSHGGGAIFANGGTIEITDSLFENNLGNGNGGGAIASTGDFFSPEVTVIRSTFRNNQTAGDFGNGGAINANGNLTVQASTFSGNQANGSITFGYGNGGGISIINGDLLVENATFSANRANGDGGGVYYRADSSATFNNVTVTANSADAGGGIYSTGDGTGNDAMLNNSLLAGNSASTGPDCFGYMDSFAGHNLIQTASGCPLMGTTTGNILGQNPLLGPLANNGGTTFTHALLAGSPAIDAGDPGASCMPTDQRGVARFDGNYDSIVRCDIGAYEYNTPFTPTPTPTPTPSSSASTAQPVLPNTGFARGRVTHLPMQPVSAAYQSYNDLTLELPTLKVSAPIVGVLKSNSQWDVSWLGNSVGWLEGSAFPTWSGNTVLTGHVWNADNTPGIFADIKTLKYGDRFYVHAFGQTYVYEVRENRLLWSKNNTAAVFKSEKYDWVTLLTCEGYNPLSGNYFFRRMVRAVLVEVR